MSNYTICVNGTGHGVILRALETSLTAKETELAEVTKQTQSLEAEVERLRDTLQNARNAGRS